MNKSYAAAARSVSVSGKPVVAKFDDGSLSSDGGILALCEVEQRLRVADRLAACLVDPWALERITHSLADMIRFRLLMTGNGCEDGIDANCLRSDPMFKMALDLTRIMQRAGGPGGCLGYLVEFGRGGSAPALGLSFGRMRLAG